MKKLLASGFFLFLVTCCFGQSEKDSIKQVYWSSDKSKCSICDEITYNGHSFRIFETPEFHLAVTGVINKKLIYASIYLENKSTKDRIEFTPNDSILAIFKKRSDKVPTEYFPLTPKEAAKKMKGNNFFKNLATGIAGGLATQETTENTTGTVRDNQGNSVDFEADSTIKSPDRQAQRRSSEIIAERNKKAKQRGNKYLVTALRANTIFPKRSISGNIYFKKKKGAYSYIVIKVKDTYYLTAWTF